MAALDNLPSFSVSTDTGENLFTIFVSGEVDIGTSPRFEAAIAERSDRAADICVDLEQCTFIDSTGMRTILAAARELRDAGRQLSVAGLHGDVAKVFELSGLLVEGSAIVKRNQ